MKNVLMCRPTHFQVKYQINPWMSVGSVRPDVAMKQWEKLVAIYESLGLTVHVINQRPGVPDMVFAADQGIIVNGKLILSRFRYPQRQKETPIYERWYQNSGLEIVKLPESVYFEGGGETVRFGDIRFIGTGFRTNKRAIKTLAKLTKANFVELHLVDDRFYHLDTCLLVLNDKTALYFPPAFSFQAQRTLRTVVPNLHEIPLAAAMNFATNAVVIDKHIVMQQGNEDLAPLINAAGLTPIFTDVGEFLKAGGGMHCLTGELE